MLTINELVVIIILSTINKLVDNIKKEVQALRVFLDCKKINFLLYDKRMTQKELANNINRNKIHINQVINRGSCNYDTAISIAEGLGVTVDEILKKKEM